MVQFDFSGANVVRIRTHYDQKDRCAAIPGGRWVPGNVPGNIFSRHQRQQAFYKHLISKSAKTTGRNFKTLPIVYPLHNL